VIAQEAPATSSSRADIDRIYGRLRSLAGQFLARERPDHTLQPTALVHEAWLRLASYRVDHDLSDEELALLAAQVMRRVLTDCARRKSASKRDGGRRIELDAVLDTGGEASAFVIEVDEALGALAEVDVELARIVELRFFGAYTLEEVAVVLDLSPRTLKRRWQLARAWLRTAMAAPAAPVTAAADRREPESESA
jgi:RNA polymerase sigma factor (TIGR02999 family)